MDIVQKIAIEIQQDGKITKAELEMLEDAILADKVVTKQEQALIEAIVAKVRGAEHEAANPIEDLSKQICSDGIVTRSELAQLHSAITADGSLSSEERMILEDIVSKLRMKKLREG